MIRKFAESAKNSTKTLNANNIPLSTLKKYKEIVFDNKLK